MNNCKEIVIVGIGEIAEIAFEYFTNDSPYKVVAFSAEENYIKTHLTGTNELYGLPVISLDELPQKFSPKNYGAFVALGYDKLNHGRAKFYNFINRMGYDLVSYVSSRAFVGVDVKIGKNCFILENNVIQRNVTIGDDVFLWSGNHIGHRSIIKNHVFLSSHVAVSGYCEIGDYCFLGINSSLADNINVAENCFIGGGVYLSQNTKPYEMYRIKPVQPEHLSTNLIFGFKED